MSVTQPLDLPSLAVLVEDAITRARAAAHAYDEAEAAARSGRAHAAAETERARAEQQAAEEQTDPPVDLDAVCAALTQRQAQDQARLARLATQVRQQVRVRLEQDVKALASLPMPELDLATVDPFRLSDLGSRRQALMGTVGRLRHDLALLAEDVGGQYRRCGLPAPAALQVPTTLPNWELSRIASLLTDDAAALRQRGTALAQAASVRAAGTRTQVVALVANGIVHGGAVALAWSAGPVVLGALAGSAVVVSAMIAVGSWWARRHAGGLLRRLHADQQTQTARVALLAEAIERAYDPQHLLREEQFARHTKERAQRTEALQRAAEVATSSARKREERLRRRLEERLANDLARARVEVVAAQQARDARLAEQRAAMAAAETARVAAVEARWDAARTQQVAAWQDAIDALRQGAAARTAAIDAEHPAWVDAAPREHAATTIPLGVVQRRLGDLLGEEQAAALPLDAQAMVVAPVALTVPEQASVLATTDARSREAVMAMTHTLIVRALAALPPGRLKLTLIDPVHLGASFAGLLNMADHDESLVGPVLVSSERIERGMEDLQAHSEVVIQKYLRGTYATITDYNRQAGELQEAQRLVVIADFPTGFTDRAVERLGTILRSGPRCGVHVVLVRDERKPLPTPIEAGWFRAHGVVLRAQGERLMVDHEALRAWSFTAAPPPPAAEQSRLLAAIGQRAVQVRRVEVSFRAIAPTEEQRWSRSADRSLRIPIGKCGADRLQEFEVGVGTAQHALIGGRTGSGKSTLFHVLVASAALWYHPREVEFHLIDFKKGVEFKTYATHRLPHARVIAIESDREFGLSVLRNLDVELTRRGEAFRKAGTHDLAAYRAAGAEFLPRIVLLIDEFQEFFTEDDAIARDAALLLDRFVRQGRAFGVHVVLGSQTLAGAYTMARSSLGQMGVRIALPCNETDAHLLLHEENDAARLLSRPGDGIYNDRAGMTEGNSPFQVCWLPEAEESAALREVARRTAAAGWAVPRTVVFEGNGPSHLEDDADLQARWGREVRAEDQRLRAVVGQASSLQGATAIDLPAAAGGNLLMVGQHREGAAATCSAIWLGFAARHPGGRLRLLALDGEDADGPFARVHARVAPALPHGIERHEARAAAEVVGMLATMLERRMAGDETDHHPVVLTIFALQRLRVLRPDDDAYGREEPPAERFAKLLAQGPEYGLHVVAWCDSLSSVQRALSRRSLRDFDTRVLFQMSANDSAELMDDDSASRLGQHTALVYGVVEGRREKFRPYDVPSVALLERLQQNSASA